MSESESSSGEEVQSILAINVPKEVNKRYYKLLWGNGDETWEPEENLTGCEKLIEEFFRDVPEAVEIYNDSVTKEAAENGLIPKLRTVLTKTRKRPMRNHLRFTRSTRNSTNSRAKSKKVNTKIKITKIVDTPIKNQSENNVIANASPKNKVKANEPPPPNYPKNKFESESDSIDINLVEEPESSGSNMDNNTNNFKGTFEENSSSSSELPSILAIYDSPIKENETKFEEEKKSERESDDDSQNSTYKFDTESESEIDQDAIFDSSLSGSLKKGELFKVNWENCFPNLDRFYDNDKNLNDYAQLKSNSASFQVLSVSSIDKIFGEDSYVVSIKIADVPQEMTIPLDLARHICPEKIIDLLVSSI